MLSLKDPALRRIIKSTCYYDENLQKRVIWNNRLALTSPGDGK
jgi:hypothetical protein